MGLSAHTRITLFDGTEKRCEDLAVGDMVREAATGASVRVDSVFHGPGVGMIRITGDNGEILDATEDQIIASTEGLSPAGQLCAGRMLHTLSGPTKCHDSERLLGDYMVYDPQLAQGTGSAYVFANGFMVAVKG